MRNLLETALLFIADYTLVFYGLGILGLLFYLNRARIAHREMRMTPFPIEREEANANVRDALVIAVIFGAILGATLYIDRILLAADSDEGGGFQLPAVFNRGDEDPDDAGNDATPGATRSATARAQPSATSPAIGPTPEMSPTPSSTAAPTDTPGATEPSATPPLPPTPELATSPEPEATATPETQQLPPTEPPLPTETQSPPTATVAPSPIPTQPPQPPPPSVPAASCPTAGVQIASPGNGATVSGAVAISGTADIPDFQFYKVEYSQGTGQGSYASIGDIIAAPVNGGRLTTWNTGGLPKGVYALRLTVVDVTGNFPPPCTVFVILQ